MQISEAKPGDLVRFTPENLSSSYNGYKVNVPITATVLAQPDYLWSHCCAIGWTAEEDVQRRTEIDVIRGMNDSARPHLTRGIHILPYTPCEVLTPPAIDPSDMKVNEVMTQKVYKAIRDMKAGDKIRVPLKDHQFTISSDNLDKEYITATVCQSNVAGGSIIVWSDMEHKKKAPKYSNTISVLSHYLDAETLKKFKHFNHAYHINSSVPCEPITGRPVKSKSVGLMFAMIGAGAGLSQLTASGVKQKLRTISAQS